MKLRHYQKELVDQTWDRSSYALFWKPRVGKTAVAISTAIRLHQENKIQAVIVLVRNPLHLNWSKVEVPQWNPESIIYEWNSGKKNYPPIIKTEKIIYFFAN